MGIRNYLVLMAIILLNCVAALASPPDQPAVSFGNFTASNEQNAIVLQWETLFENNTIDFEIQRSAHNNDLFFFMVATVSAAGNSSAKKQYRFVDESVQEGTHYYRIKHYDTVNGLTYSPIISISYAPATLVKRFLNPIGSVLFAEFTSFDPTTSSINEWRMYDLNGRMLGTARITSKTVYATIPSVLPGIYIWEFRVNDKKQRVRLLRL